MCCTCPPCPSRSSAFPMLAPRRIRRSPDWLCMPFPLQCWLWAPCWAVHYAFLKRRTSARAKGRVEAAHPEDQSHHIEFESIPHQLLTPFNWLLLAIMAFGVVSLIARLALGLGGSTHLSDTYAWGLWIVFDLVWIAVAAGAFATAGFIYVFQRKDLYSMGRSAVCWGS